MVIAVAERPAGRGGNRMTEQAPWLGQFTARSEPVYGSADEEWSSGPAAPDYAPVAAAISSSVGIHF